MSTSYAIRCLVHEREEAEPPGWPESGVYAHQLRELWFAIDHRAAIIEVGAVLDVTLTFSWDERSLCEFLDRHRSCELGVFNEYGEPRGRGDG